MNGSPEPVPHTAHWSHFPHQADVGVRGTGPTVEAAFEQAALALTAAVADPAAIEPRERVPIHCEAPDLELLLVDWLNALVYEMAVGRRLFGAFRVRIRDGVLDGEALGEPVDPARHGLGAEAKGVTYTALKVARQPDGAWLAQCVVDV